jgi:hypothetical protein
MSFSYKNHAFTRVLFYAIRTWNIKIQSKTIIEALRLEINTYFDLIELVVGGRIKTEVLFREQDWVNYNLDVMPGDIYHDALDNFQANFNL